MEALVFLFWLVMLMKGLFIIGLAVGLFFLGRATVKYKGIRFIRRDE